MAPKSVPPNPRRYVHSREEPPLTEAEDRWPFGLDSLTQREQRDRGLVLRVLDHARRFTVWSTSANQIIARTVDALTAGGYIIVTPRGFPWSDVRLTNKGRELMEREYPAEKLDKNEPPCRRGPA